MSYKLTRQGKADRSGRSDKARYGTRGEVRPNIRFDARFDTKGEKNILKSGSKVNRRSRNAYSDSGKKTSFRLWPRSVRFPSLRVLKGALGLVFCLAIGAVLLLGIGVGSLYLYRFATTNPFFATKQVDVLGNVRLSREMVQDLAGVHVGNNSLAVSIAKVERALLKTPWVEDVSVKRLLPDRFVIRVHERMPSFWVRKDGVLYYADAKATIIAPVETSNLMPLPTLEVEAGAEEALGDLEGYLKDLKSGDFPVEFGAVSGLTLSPGKGLELYLEDREMRLSLATDDWHGNLERLGITLGDLARRNELGTVREVRAADGNVWVIKREP